jgi:hypothetical protein
MSNWPVGTQDERAVAVKKLPGKWENDNPYLNKYRFGYHTGADFEPELRRRGTPMRMRRYMRAPMGR